MELHGDTCRRGHRNHGEQGRETARHQKFPGSPVPQCPVQTSQDGDAEGGSAARVRPLPGGRHLSKPLPFPSAPASGVLALARAGSRTYFRLQCGYPCLLPKLHQNHGEQNERL